MLVVKQLQGETIDWKNEYEILTARRDHCIQILCELLYVDTSLQSVIFFADGQPDVKANGVLYFSGLCMG
ncbi:hypothetical protein ACOBV8_19800 (plasmid) [Pseudoalteromonas espejiana]